MLPARGPPPAPRGRGGHQARRRHRPRLRRTPRCRCSRSPRRARAASGTRSARRSPTRSRDRAAPPPCARARSGPSCSPRSRSRPAEGQTGHMRLARFIGVDGPRWFLRGVIAGEAAVDPGAAAQVEDLFRSIVVVRGIDADAAARPHPAPHARRVVRRAHRLAMPTRRRARRDERRCRRLARRLPDARRRSEPTPHGARMPRRATPARRVRPPVRRRRGEERPRRARARRAADRPRPARRRRRRPRHPRGAAARPRVPRRLQLLTSFAGWDPQAALGPVARGIRRPRGRVHGRAHRDQGSAHPGHRRPRSACSRRPRSRSGRATPATTTCSASSRTRPTRSRCSSRCSCAGRRSASIVGFLMGDGLAWREDKRKYRAAQFLTLVWIGLFVARLVVQVPLLPRRQRRGARRHPAAHGRAALRARAGVHLARRAGGVSVVRRARASDRVISTSR